MRQGWIYIFTNPLYSKDIIKIGKTTFSPAERARQLSSPAGVPDDFEVAYQIEVEDCDIAEKIIHNKMKNYRTKENKEWYNLPTWKAITNIEIVVENINKMLQEIDFYIGIIDERFHKERFNKIKQYKINKVLDAMSEDEQNILEKEFEESIKDDNILWEIYTHNGYIGPVERKWWKILEEKFLTEDERTYEVFRKEMIDRRNRFKKLLEKRKMGKIDDKAT